MARQKKIQDPKTPHKISDGRALKTWDEISELGLLNPDDSSI